MRSRNIIVSILALGLFVLIIFSMIDRTRNQVKGIGNFFGETAWEYIAPSNIVNNIVSGDSRVYIRTRQKVVALNALTGEIVWQAATRGLLDQVGQSLIIDDVVVFSESVNGHIRAYDRYTGEVVWEDCGRCYSDVTDIKAIVDKLLVGRRSEGFTLYDARTGEVSWQIEHSTRSEAWVETYGDTAFLLMGNSVQAVNVETGSIIWEEKYSGDVGRAQTDGQFLFFFVHRTDFTYDLISINLATFESIWLQQVPLAQSQSRFRQYLYLDDENHTLYTSGSSGIASINSQNGEIMWYFESDTRMTQAVKFQEHVIVRTNDRILAFLPPTNEPTSILHTVSFGVNQKLVQPTTINEILIVQISPRLLHAYGGD